jgi:hypothetical protein
VPSSLFSLKREKSKWFERELSEPEPPTRDAWIKVERVATPPETWACPANCPHSKAITAFIKAAWAAFDALGCERQIAAGADHDGLVNGYLFFELPEQRALRKEFSDLIVQKIAKKFPTHNNLSTISGDDIAASSERLGQLKRRYEV